LPERPMGGDCKSPGSAFEGSNPSPATTVLNIVDVLLRLAIIVHLSINVLF